MTTNDKFSDLINQEEVAVACADMSGTIQKANNAFCQLTGYSLAQLQTKTYHDLTPEKWFKFENDHIIKEVFDKGHSNYSKEYIHADGHIFPVNLDVYLMRDENDQPIGLWGKVRKE